MRPGALAGALLWVVCLLRAAVVDARNNITLKPIVIVPGLGGSVLEARLHNRSKFRDCAVDADWFTIFFSEVQALLRYDCFVDNLELRASAAGISNTDGVDIRPRDYGGVGGVEYSNAGSIDMIPVPYMHDLIVALEKHGYERNKTLRAATYDFRAAGHPSTTTLQYTQLRLLVEQTAKDVSSPVHLLSHSLGGPYTTLFLNMQSPEWKAEYIASHIMMSSPLAGTPVALEGILAGPRFDDVPQFLPRLVAPIIKTFPSMLWMAPRGDVWRPDMTFMSSPSYTYTESNWSSLLLNINASLLTDVNEAVQTFTAASAGDPGVPVLCVYVNDTKTDLSFTSSTDQADGTIKAVEQTWGDGTVNLPSLELCKTWQGTTASVHTYGGSINAHTNIVKIPSVINAVLRWVAVA